MSVVVLGPGGDAAEAVLRDIGRHCLAAAGHRPGLRVLWGGDACRRQVDLALQVGGHVLYFGHGFGDRLGEPPLVDGRNIAGASGHVVLALACSSAAGLGRDAVDRHGVRAFLGFTRPVFVPLASSRWSRCPWYVAPTRLLAGDTAGATAEQVCTAFRAEGDRILAEPHADYQRAVTDMLLHYGMAHAFACRGSRRATL